MKVESVLPDILLTTFTIQLKSLSNLIPRSLGDGRPEEERGGEGRKVE